MVIYRLPLSLLCLLLLVGAGTHTSAHASPEQDVRYLRLYMTDMHGWGEIRDMSMVVGDNLFVSLLAEDSAGNPVSGATVRIQSRQGNRISTDDGRSDKDGWIHADITAVKPGEDLVSFQIGERDTQLRLSIVGEQEQLPPTLGQLGQGQTLTVDYPGALPWSLMSDVTPGKDFAPPSFGSRISEYDGKEVIMQGFMLPLENAERQGHFILSANPPHCYFCMPGGAESMVETFAAPPLSFSYDPVVVQGTLQLIRDDQAMGLYYRLRGVKQLQ